MVCDVYIASGVHQHSSVKNKTFLLSKLIQNIYKEGKDFVYLVCAFMKYVKHCKICMCIVYIQKASIMFVIIR